MPRKPTGNPNGRPLIEIDWKKFDALCKIQCTLNEIASIFDCSIDTIENKVKEAHGITFSDYRAQKAEGGKASLRRMQWKSAEDGNTTMLIWLGKNILGQTDKVQNEISGPNGSPVQSEVSVSLTNKLAKYKDLFNDESDKQ